MDIDEFVALSVKHNASDLHLCTGHLPMLRIDGELQAVESGEILTQQQMAAWCQTQLSQTMWQQLQQVGQLDLALALADGTRLRANFFLQNAGVSVALRRIASQCPTLAELTTPEIIPALLQREDGLILVTGATGSGKSTTLAAMIDFINRHQRRHILTLEDPIEFIHRSQRSLIQQRELGRDTHSFDDALRAALREDPDVILLGELRDTTTVRLALTAAETGHLVLATLHTRSAPQAVERLVDVFPAEEKAYVRAQLASSLQAVIAQKLLSKPGGGRVAIYEILTATAAVSSMIREGKTHQLVSVLQTGAQSGMQTFEQGLQQRVAQGIL
ncbi:TPA: type IV pilus twitching motility protein PilT [Serratia fonticola]|jgi:twitching motility protein PilT|uniref:Type II secretory pathway, ATPase PulE/Tfp pilus assembly pathway, ATPase PilB n=1 Tax=Serratia fonticola TaxID=47917 RepID=A0A448T5Y0_SERFO|nr:MULTISPECIES: type IV pilus twitching motility protein PilT [Serratia]ERK11372.1 Twitching motility protein PilT [Serratia fonticola AU-AP2C]AYM91941.1 type IV pilus twitching motility protein PilT [Serratia sp. 3ACOL1]MBL5828045.1 type IV pilus twitching motility protein PilT [Serratia fonticola]MBL5903140.1 type IV pilus twitching motility protein PilT [Serratia fonticola]MDK2375760.1 type IV pilus twitching motility protein PilT [Serratia fonticola]